MLQIFHIFYQMYFFFFLKIEKFLKNNFQANLKSVFEKY